MFSSVVLFFLFGRAEPVCVGLRLHGLINCLLFRLGVIVAELLDAHGENGALKLLVEPFSRQIEHLAEHVAHLKVEVHAQGLLDFLDGQVAVAQPPFAGNRAGDDQRVLL